LTERYDGIRANGNITLQFLASTIGRGKLSALRSGHFNVEGKRPQYLLNTRLRRHPNWDWTPWRRDAAVRLIGNTTTISRLSGCQPNHRIDGITPVSQKSE